MPENFKELVDAVMTQPGRMAMRPVVEKEILHYDIFYALDAAGLLKDLVFQRGSGLRWREELHLPETAGNQGLHREAYRPAIRPVGRGKRAEADGGISRLRKCPR